MSGSCDEVQAVEFLYGIVPGHWEGNDDWQPARVVALRITKKTPKRIYYVSRDWDWGPWQPIVRCVDRQKIEADGEIYPPSRRWFEQDAHLYLAPPVTEEAAKPDLAELIAAMTAAHPDCGGSTLRSSRCESGTSGPRKAGEVTL